MTDKKIFDICDISGCHKKLNDHSKTNLLPLIGIAVKLKDPDSDLEAIFTFPRGKNYMEIYKRIYRGTGKFPDTLGNCEEGYYNAGGVFVSKEKAKQIAIDLMLIDPDKKILFPEDLFGD